MRNIIKIVALKFCFVIVAFQSVLAGEASVMQYDLNIPGVTLEMLNADFWVNLNENHDDLIMDDDEIQRFNRNNLRQCKVLKDLRNFKKILSGDEVRSLIAKVSSRPESKRYLNGQLLGSEYFATLEENLNTFAVPEIVVVKYGITVRRTEMRTFPTYDRVFSEPDDIETDRFIETALYPVEPLVILHQSLDKKWFLAQAYNYLAWVPVEAVALTDRKELFDYVDTKPFLVVTGKGVLTAFNPVNPDISELQLDMGVRVPLAKREEIPLDIDGQHPAGNYVVKLPIRDSKGKLQFKLGLIAMADDVRAGYLPLTRRNIIRQAFKFLGQRYGWGGMFNTRDCSAFIMDNFRSMGVLLPRNAGEQGKMSFGVTHEFTRDMTVEQRSAVFDRLSATPIYMNGHAMLFLGKFEGDYYIIHDFAGFRAPDESGKMKSSKTRCVFVTPLLKTFLSSGKKYIEGLYAAREFNF
ncbi:MAG: SH3 domain-containing protein [Candidatus Riflebacteria bacterium]